MFGCAGKVILTLGEIALPDQVFVITEGNNGSQWGFNQNPPMFGLDVGSIDDDTWNGTVPGQVQNVMGDHDSSGFDFWLDGPSFERTEGEIYSIQATGINGGVPLIVGVGSSFLYNSFYGNRWQWATASVDGTWNGSGNQTITVATHAP